MRLYFTKLLVVSSSKPSSQSWLTSIQLLLPIGLILGQYRSCYGIFQCQKILPTLDEKLHTIYWTLEIRSQKLKAFSCWFVHLFSQKIFHIFYMFYQEVSRKENI